MSEPAITVTRELLAVLKQRAAEANSVYALALRVFKQQRKAARAQTTGETT